MAIPEKIAIALAFVAFLSGCYEQRAPDGGGNSAGPKAECGHVIDAEEGSLCEIRVGMSVAEVLQLGYATSQESVLIEGDEYQLLKVDMGGVPIEAVFAAGSLHEFSTSATNVRDSRGLGVGSTLGELRSAYPLGQLVVGYADMKHANFVNGSKLKFKLDQSGIGETCFEHGTGGCQISDSVSVSGLAVNADLDRHE